jgi:hypothetical protein
LNNKTLTKGRSFESNCILPNSPQINICGTSSNIKEKSDFGLSSKKNDHFFLKIAPHKTPVLTPRKLGEMGGSSNNKNPSDILRTKMREKLSF